jgi:hypothetical protein
MNDLSKHVSVESVMNSVLAAQGDLSVLGFDELNVYLNYLIDKYGLDRASAPIRLIRDKDTGKLLPYATKAATDQIRLNNGISVVEQNMQFSPTGDAVIVTVKVVDRTGRMDIDTGSVLLTGAIGEEYSNKIMACVTKAKRRATLAISGISILDEIEVQSMAYKFVTVEQPSQINNIVNHENNDVVNEPHQGASISQQDKERIDNLINNTVEMGSWNTTLNYIESKYANNKSLLAYALSQLDKARNKEVMSIDSDSDESLIPDFDVDPSMFENVSDVHDMHVRNDFVEQDEHNACDAHNNNNDIVFAENQPLSEIEGFFEEDIGFIRNVEHLSFIQDSQVLHSIPEVSIIKSNEPTQTDVVEVNRGRGRPKKS